VIEVERKRQSKKDWGFLVLNQFEDIPRFVKSFLISTKMINMNLKFREILEGFRAREKDGSWVGLRFILGMVGYLLKSKLNSKEVKKTLF